MEFSGKSVIVTGGTRGIGRAVVRAFLEQGARVYAIFQSDETSALSTLDENSDYAENLSIHRVDISSEEQVDTFFDSLDDLHVLVNNAGITADGPLTSMSLEQFERVIRVNLIGTFLMSRHAVEIMAAEETGSIINLTSPSGEIGLPGQANYAASKAGIVAFTKVLARETAGLGIRANCVSPGFTETEMIAAIAPQQKKVYEGQIAMRRFGSPEEVANVILFLASERSSYVTGETYRVTGGM